MVPLSQVIALVGMADCQIGGTHYYLAVSSDIVVFYRKYLGAYKLVNMVNQALFLPALPVQSYNRLPW